MLPLLLSVLLPTANAQDLGGLDDVVAIDTTSTDRYQFQLPRCDRLKAQFRDDRPRRDDRGPKVIITFENVSETTCMFKGLSLKGGLQGSYKVAMGAHRGPDFFIPPGQEVSLRIHLADPDAPRERIRVLIPPGSGVIVLEGLPAEEAPVYATP